MCYFNHICRRYTLVACSDGSLSVEKYLTKLNSSHWLDYSRDVLICACVVSNYIHQEGKTSPADFSLIRIITYIVSRYLWDMQLWELKFHVNLCKSELTLLDEYIYISFTMKQVFSTKYKWFLPLFQLFNWYILSFYRALSLRTISMHLVIHYIVCMIKFTCYLLFIIYAGATVLVHGASGTDTTLQVTSMVQLILDPDCRTIRG